MKRETMVHVLTKDLSNNWIVIRANSYLVDKEGCLCLFLDGDEVGFLKPDIWRGVMISGLGDDVGGYVVNKVDDEEMLKRDYDNLKKQIDRFGKKKGNKKSFWYRRWFERSNPIFRASCGDYTNWSDCRYAQRPAFDYDW